MTSHPRSCFCFALLFIGACNEPSRPEPAEHRGAPASSAEAARAEITTATEGTVPLGPPVDEVREAMGTRIRFIAYPSGELDRARIVTAIDQAFATLVHLDGLMSTWRADSELSRLNRQGGRWVETSVETFEVFRKARWASDLSEGAFDVTFHGLGDLWRFGDAAEKKPRIPSVAEVRARLPRVNYRNVELDEARLSVRLRQGTQVDFGGIAKGYAVDRAATVLTASGVKSFLLQAGGDLYGAGRKPNGSAWTSGIRDPRGGSDDFFAVIELEDHAFSTAGDYARSFIAEGKRYHHIIDPKTGFPATECRSVTVWAKDAFTADAIDDAVFILGPQRGLALVESLPDTGAVIVDKNNKVWISERLRDQVRLLRQPTDGI